MNYLKEGYRQLFYPNFYTKIGEDPTCMEGSSKITNILTEIKNRKIITDRNFEYLNPTNTREGKFYLLSKIQKKGIPGRHICSSVNHPTSTISQFVHAHINNMYQTQNRTLERPKISLARSKI